MKFDTWRYRRIPDGVIVTVRAHRSNAELLRARPEGYPNRDWHTWAWARFVEDHEPILPPLAVLEQSLKLEKA